VLPGLTWAGRRARPAHTLHSGWRRARFRAGYEPAVPQPILILHGLGLTSAHSLPLARPRRRGAFPLRAAADSRRRGVNGTVCSRRPFLLLSGHRSNPLAILDELIYSQGFFGIGCCHSRSWCQRGKREPGHMFRSTSSVKSSHLISSRLWIPHGIRYQVCKLLVPTPITRSVSSYGLLRQKQKGGAPFKAPDLEQLSVDHPRLSDSDSMAQVVSSTSSSQLFLFFIAGSSSSSRSHAPTGTNADCAVRSDSWLSCVFSKATGVFAVTGFFDGTHSCNCSKEIKETHAEFLAQGHRYTDTSSPSTWIMNNIFFPSRS